MCSIVLSQYNIIRFILSLFNLNFISFPLNTTAIFPWENDICIIFVKSKGLKDNSILNFNLSSNMHINPNICSPNEHHLCLISFWVYLLDIEDDELYQLSLLFSLASCTVCNLSWFNSFSSLFKCNFSAKKFIWCHLYSFIISKTNWKSVPFIFNCDGFWINFINNHFSYFSFQSTWRF